MTEKQLEKEIMQVILDNHDKIEAASDDVREALNKAIDRYRLNPRTTLAVLADISAAYVHMLQRSCSTPEKRDEVDQFYVTAFDTYQGLQDMHDMDVEAAKEQRKHLN